MLSSRPRDWCGRFGTAAGCTRRWEADRFQDEATVSTVRIFQNACSPMTRGNVRYGQISVTRTLPPIQFDDFRKSKVRNQVGYVRRNDDGRSYAAAAEIVLHNRAQRWAMQVIEMGM